MPPDSTQPTVAIAGGGLAGLAAACALADSNFRVTLFERRPYLGGRASSYQHPGTGEVVDNCQHVLFRVCTNLVEFYRRIGVEDKIRWYDEMTFIEPGGRSTVMHASPLPAPLHTAPSFLQFPFLNAKDKLAISRAIAALTLRNQPDTGRSFLDWCHQHGQTETAINRFWKPILISALSEDLDLISISYAAQVVRESMKSPAARHMGVPSIPLTSLYNAAGDYIRARHGQINFRNSLESFSRSPEQVQIRTTEAEGNYDYTILALPFESLDRVLPKTPEAAPLRENLTHFEHSPITGIHLWFDRQITDLDHAVLLDRTTQWMFHKSRLLDTRGANSESGGSYIELVVSASKSLIDRSRAEIVDLALKEVREFFPAAREATLIKSTVIKELHAVYSPRPGIDAHRPPQSTAWPRVFLAGDFTATGWPATMEGAVRSGYLAAQALTRTAGIKDRSFLVPDLPASGLMRLFTR
ncbi:MAG TPA: hydroxysqualene dehydroxylase HpnE [Candidatus Dormibacteraeota bacterium]|nr:hydroxysqualene dehydroxylase HpnE [Candidatus Dormibacteraeota bacterium]